MPIKDTKMKGQGKKRKSVKKRALLFIALGSMAYWFSKNKEKVIKFTTFAKKEEEEIEKLLEGKESPKTFWNDSKKLLKDFFIPHEGNGHKPHSLRPKSLITYVLIALVIKLAGTGFLFFIYPNKAEMSRIITSEIVDLANESRVKFGLMPFRVDQVLSETALIKGEDMIARGYFSHDTPEGKRPWLWIDKDKYDYVYAGENLAMDFSSADLIHNAFMKSPTHRKNIINPKYIDIGVAVVSGDMGGSETDVLVQFFGTKRSDLALLNEKKVVLVPTKEIARENPRPSVVSAPQTTPQDSPDTPEIQETPIQPEVTETVRETELQENVLGENTSDTLIGAREKKSFYSRLAHAAVVYSNLILIAFLIFIGLLLILNIFIRFHIQHKALIAQTLAVIAIISFLLIARFHFAQDYSVNFIIL